MTMLTTNLEWAKDSMDDDSLNAGSFVCGSVRRQRKLLNRNDRWYVWIHDEDEGHELGWYKSQDEAKVALLKEVTKLLTH